jgi:DNA polymerase-3 subunit delta'
MIPLNIKHACILIEATNTAERLDFAKNFAKQLLCKNVKKGMPCQNCSSCNRISKEIHPDVLIVKPVEDDVIKIDTIRDICYELQLSPLEGERKICIIDECHRMVEAAQNAFLKTLEEPRPNRTILLLTNKKDTLIQTLISRCLEYKPLELNKYSEPVFEGVKKISEIESKEEALYYLQSREQYYRNKILKEQDPFDDLDSFEKLLESEGRLRSNANYGLMLESLDTL